MLVVYGYSIRRCGKDERGAMLVKRLAMTIERMAVERTGQQKNVSKKVAVKRER